MSTIASRAAWSAEVSRGTANESADSGVQRDAVEDRRCEARALVRSRGRRSRGSGSDRHRRRRTSPTPRGAAPSPATARGSWTCRSRAARPSSPGRRRCRRSSLDAGRRAPGRPAGGRARRASPRPAAPGAGPRGAQRRGQGTVVDGARRPRRMSAPLPPVAQHAPAGHRPSASPLRGEAAPTFTSAVPFPETARLWSDACPRQMRGASLPRTHRPPELASEVAAPPEEQQHARRGSRPSAR